MSEMRSSKFVSILLGYGLAKLLPGLVSLAAVPIWLALFGPSEYALYSSLWSVVVISTGLVGGWLRQSILRYAGRADLQLYSLPTWVLPTLAAVNMMPLILMLGINALGLSAIDILLGCAFAVVNSYYTIFQSLLQRSGLAHVYAFADTLRVIIALLTSLLLGNVTSLSGASSILAGFTLGSMVSCSVLFWGSQHQVRVLVRGRSSGTMNPSALRMFWNYGWPMSLWLGLSTLLVYVDRIIVTSVVGGDEAGVYAATSDLIVRGFAMVTFPITMASHPVLMKLWNGGDQFGALRANAKLVRWLTLYAAVGVVVTSIVGGPVLEHVLGFPYVSPCLVLFLSLGAALWQIALLAHKPLELMNRTMAMVGYLALAVVVSLVLSLVFTPLYGSIVPAMSLSIGALVYVACTYVHGSHLAHSIGAIE